MICILFLSFLFTENNASLNAEADDKQCHFRQQLCRHYRKSHHLGKEFQKQAVTEENTDCQQQILKTGCRRRLLLKYQMGIHGVIGGRTDDPRRQIGEKCLHRACRKDPDQQSEQYIIQAEA